ncbi:MAG: metalloregulator ArsR/SmtB family transcription factor [Alphaproteobacteria bacterium]|nr:metalloregulator ArsR/SmtB family transcription factor [Alphaproteobacteria bacterium]
MAGGAAAAADFLKSLANADRLLILCHLSEGEMTVGELETVFGVRQATMSQRLAVLRDAGLVKTRRDGKSIYYSLASDEAKQTIALMYDLFCAQD